MKRTRRRAATAGAILAGLLAAGPAGATDLWEILFGHGRGGMGPHRPRPPAPAPIAPGRSVGPLAGRVGERQYFELRVAPGTVRLEVRTAGGAGDCDVYLSPGRLPEPKDYHYASTGPTTAETVVVPAPRPGAWYVLLHGYERFTGVVLTVRAAGPPPARPSVRILHPAPGEVLPAGRPVTIRWAASGPTRRVVVAYSLDDGRTWVAVGPLGGLPAAAGQAAWAVPQLVGRRPAVGALVKVIDAERPHVPAATVAVTIRRTGPPGGGHRPGGGHGPGRPHPGSADPFEPNDRSAEAGRVEVGRTQRHLIARPGDEDWLMFVPPAPGAYRVLLTDATAGLKVSLYSARRGGKKEYYARSFTVGRGGYALDLLAGANALYFKLHVRARDRGDTGAYRVTVEQVVGAMPAPTRRPGGP